MTLDSMKLLKIVNPVDNVFEVYCRWWRRLKTLPPIYIYILRYFRYNRNGWLGVKHQVAYLLRYLKSQCMQNILITYNITEIEITEG